MAALTDPPPVLDPRLLLEPRLAEPDEIYAALVALHAGRSTEESLKLWARLVLILANQLGDAAQVQAAIALAAAPPQDRAPRAEAAG